MMRESIPLLGFVVCISCLVSLFVGNTEKPKRGINVGVAWSGTEENHTIHGLSVPYYAWPLKSTGVHGQYLDANGKQVKFPTELILFDEGHKE